MLVLTRAARRRCRQPLTAASYVVSPSAAGLIVFKQVQRR